MTVRGESIEAELEIAKGSEGDLELEIAHLEAELGLEFARKRQSGALLRGRGR